MKKTILSTLIAGTALMGLAGTAQAMDTDGVSFEAGIESQYIFRGIAQTDGPSTNVAAGYAHDSGFSVDIAAITTDGSDLSPNADSGLELDLAAGYAGNFKGVDFGAGVSLYDYTNEVADLAKEVNFSAGYSIASVNYDYGFVDGTTDTETSNVSASLEYKGFTATYGENDLNVEVADDEVTYMSVGYTTEVTKGLDMTVAYINSDYSGTESSDDFLTVGIQKTF